MLVGWLVEFTVVVAMGLKKQVYHVKTELVKRLQRQRRHYFATGLCSTMCAPRCWQLIIQSAKRLNMSFSLMSPKINNSKKLINNSQQLMTELNP